jgi:hypothetical protein
MSLAGSCCLGWSTPVAITTRRSTAACGFRTRQVRRWRTGSRTTGGGTESALRRRRRRREGPQQECGERRHPGVTPREPEWAWRADPTSPADRSAQEESDEQGPPAGRAPSPREALHQRGTVQSRDTTRLTDPARTAGRYRFRPICDSDDLVTRDACPSSEAVARAAAAETAPLARESGSLVSPGESASRRLGTLASSLRDTRRRRRLLSAEQARLATGVRFVRREHEHFGAHLSVRINGA